MGENRGREGKDGIVVGKYFLLSLCFCLFLEEKGKIKSPKLYVHVKLYESET